MFVSKNLLRRFKDLHNFLNNMALKLSEQLDADPIAAFALYNKYVENYRYKFPESVLSVIENPQWRDGGCDSNSPHDAEFKNILFSGIGTERNRIELLISKPWLNLEIQVNYLGVFDFNLQGTGNLEKLPSWRYEQFRYYDPYHEYQIKNKKMFTHDIELHDGIVWNITASNIEVIWQSN